MNDDNAIGVSARFKERFSRQYAGAIRRMVEDARAEAMAQARTMLRDEAGASLVSHHRHEAAGPGLHTGGAPNDPELARRIVRELHAMRRQIGRNEELLGRVVLPHDAE